MVLKGIVEGQVKISRSKINLIDGIQVHKRKDRSRKQNSMQTDDDIVVMYKTRKQ